MSCTYTDHVDRGVCWLVFWYVILMTLEYNMHRLHNLLELVFMLWVGLCSCAFHHVASRISARIWLCDRVGNGNLANARKSTPQEQIEAV